MSRVGQKDLMACAGLFEPNFPPLLLVVFALIILP
jgi:hypothetical protein